MSLQRVEAEGESFATIRPGDIPLVIEALLEARQILGSRDDAGKTSTPERHPNDTPPLPE